MNRKINDILLDWVFPGAAAVAYWLFDSMMAYVTPLTTKGMSLLNAVFPDIGSPTFYFRIALTVATVYGAWLFERTMRRLAKIQRQLFLSEYAVENTKAFEMMWCDEEGQIIKANKFAADRLGYTKKELLSLHVRDISPTHNEETWRKLREVLKDKGEARYLTQHRTKAGALVPAVMHIQFLHSRGHEYQFAFVCDARLCPIVAATEVTPCGHSPLPSMTEFLKEASA